MVKIAVYGTLKRGHYNHKFLNKSQFIGEGRTVDKYKMTSNGHFPYLSKNGDYNTKVEVFEIDNETLKNVDRLEGHPDFYKREVINVLVGEDVLKCWIYLTPSKGQILLKDEF